MPASHFEQSLSPFVQACSPLVRLIGSPHELFWQRLYQISPFSDQII